MEARFKIDWDNKLKDGIRPGDVLQEVHDRVQYLNEVLPCYENDCILYHLEWAIYWEKGRKKRREVEKVKGTMQPHSY